MRFLKPILFVSLAINFLLVGAMIAFFASGQTKQKRPFGRDAAIRQAPPAILWPLLSQLDRETRKALGRDVQNRHRAAGFDRDAVRAIQHRLAEAIEQEPFNVAETKAVVAELRTYSVKRSVIAEDAMIEVLQGLSLEKRREVAEAIRTPRKKRRR